MIKNPPPSLNIGKIKSFLCTKPQTIKQDEWDALELAIKRFPKLSPFVPFKVSKKSSASLTRQEWLAEQMEALGFNPQSLSDALGCPPFDLRRRRIKSLVQKPPRRIRYDEWTPIKLALKKEIQKAHESRIQSAQILQPT